jgi:hypothetical protein
MEELQKMKVEKRDGEMRLVMAIRVLSLITGGSVSATERMGRN